MNTLSKRISSFLIDIVIQEQSEEAWMRLKQFELDCADLAKLFLYSPFSDEAWELFKGIAGKSDLIGMIEKNIKDETKLEIESILFERFELSREELNKLVWRNNSDRAAQLLLDQSPTDDELYGIMRYTNLANQAAEELMKRETDASNFYEIIEGSKSKIEAWNQFLQLSPTIQDISYVVLFTDLEDVAWKYLLEQNPNDDELMDFVNDYSETGRKQKEAARILLDRKTKKKHLVNIIQMGVYTEEAWALFMSKKPKYKHLWNLLKHEQFKSKANEIADYCLALKPKKLMLLDILAYSDRKDEAAAKIIEMPLEISELADVIVQSTIEPVLNLVSQRVQFDRSQVNEEKMIHEIASMILSNPDVLDVNNWHREHRHSVGGWAIALSEAAQEVEKNYSSEIAACLLLPNYKHLFFADKHTVIKELQKILSNFEAKSN